MSRTYSTTTCWLCGQKISNCGVARVNHMRKHVRDGECEEVKTSHGSRFRAVVATHETAALAESPDYFVNVEGDYPALAEQAKAQDPEPVQDKTAPLSPEELASISDEVKATVLAAVNNALGTEFTSIEEVPYQKLERTWLLLQITFRMQQLGFRCRICESTNVGPDGLCYGCRLAIIEQRLGYRPPEPGDLLRR